MFNKYCLLILLSLFGLLNSNQARAQSVSMDNLQNLKVSQFTDKQVLDIWERLLASGVSEEMAYQQMLQRGLPATEIEAFKKRVAEIQFSGTDAKAPLNKTSDKAPLARDTVLPVVPVPRADLRNPIYGFDFFNNSKLTFEPNVRMATPKSYVLGPDDEVVVQVTGLNERTVTTKITPEGTIQVPYAGLIFLNGLTIEQANTAVRNKLSAIYPAISSGATKVYVSLGNVRSIRVTIIGEVRQPGTYSISSLSTVFNALYLSQGPSGNGSLRNIELIRNNRVYRVIDFYTFLQQGLLSDNISLQDQDVIRFPVYQKRVTIAGAVKRPAVYELKETETLADLLRYAGGFADEAYKSMAKVSQMGDKERSIRDVPEGLFDRYLPGNADSVYFEAILGRYTNRVFLSGAVYRPGVFELTPNLSLMQLIEKGDGLRTDAFLTRGYIKRTTPELEKKLVSFDLTRIRAGQDPDIMLLREDTVNILSAHDLKEGQIITIEGYVRRPGSYFYRNGMSLQDVVAMAGGFSTAAATHRIEISRILKDASDVAANQLVKTFTVELDSSLYSKNSVEFKIQPLDFIHVPRLVNFHAIGNVRIEGEVLFPGNYSIQRRDETIQELISRSGGLTPYGSLENAQIFRRGIRVDADLDDLSANSTARPFIVMPGDSILIPRENMFVEVSGAVNTPQLISYANRGFKYYINTAGGVTQNAKLKRAYIQNPDGTNMPVKQFLFFRNYPKVLPGSKITVPQDQNPFKLKLGVGEVSALASVLTALVGLAAILSK